MTSVLHKPIQKIAAYIANKYDASVLSQHQTCKELLLRGNELSRILGTGKLPSLNIRDIAQYIVIHT